MSEAAEFVREFHTAFGCAIGQPPTEALRVLRAKLIEEEMAEAGEAAVAALLGGSLADVAKELADAIYVLYGAADAFGIDLDRALAAVHASNMSKLGADGQPLLREDGKVLKGPTYQEADVSGALLRVHDTQTFGVCGCGEKCPTLADWQQHRARVAGGA